MSDRFPRGSGLSEFQGRWQIEEHPARPQGLDRYPPAGHPHPDGRSHHARRLGRPDSRDRVRGAVRLSDSCRRRRFVHELAAKAAELLDRGLDPDSDEFVTEMDKIVRKWRGEDD